MKHDTTLIQRFWAKVEIDARGCWNWRAATRNGYGRFWTAPGLVEAHRWSYEQFVGPIPEGLTIDHLCRNPRCVRPDHLEPVTQRENLLRGETLTAAHFARRDCGFMACPRCRRFRLAEQAAS